MSGGLWILFNDGDGTFTGPVWPQESCFFEGAYGSLLGDVDADGDNDILVQTHCVYCEFSSLTLLLNDGQGVFPECRWLKPGSLPGSCMLTDADGDGDLDCRVARCSDVVTLVNPGGGEFGSFGGLPGSGHGGNVIGADLDADGDLDFVNASADCTDGPFADLTVSVAWKEEDGYTYSLVYAGPGCDASPLLAHDMDGDADLDLVFDSSLWSSPGLIVLENQGDHSFTSTIIGQYEGMGGLAAADLDHDGDGDLALTAGSSIFLIVNNGDMSFTDGAILDVGAQLGQIASADIDRDGYADLIVAAHETSILFLLFGDADGVFAAPVALDVGEEMLDFALGRMNRDSRLDLVIAHPDSVAICGSEGQTASSGR
jgi:hypothetical protein